MKLQQQGKRGRKLMKINYIEYQQNLFEKAIDDQKNTIFIFDNYNNLETARSYRDIPLFQNESLFLTTAELKEKLFPSDKLVLKEEKLALIFYDILSQQEKEELNINDYFDAVEPASYFFRLFKELNEFNIKKLNDLQQWQQKKYEIFKNIREKYINRMEELGYTDITLNYNFDNFDLNYIDDYEELIFINKLYFTPKEKDIINEIENSGFKVKLFLQVRPRDFDENELKLKSVSLPEEKNVNIKLYKTDDRLLQLVNIINQKEKKEKKSIVLDADFENSNYHQLLNNRQIGIEKEISFTETDIFKFLEIMYELLETSVFNNGQFKIEIEKVLKAVKMQFFKEYYNLDIKDIEYIQELANNDFVYLSNKLLSDKEKLQNIFDEIKKLRDYHSLAALCSYLESINLEKLQNNYFKDDIAQYFDGLLELRAIRDMDIIEEWNSYFTGDNAVNLFLLIINYLRFKKVEKVNPDSQPEFEIQDLLDSSHVNRSRIIIINASGGIIPSSETGGFLFTEEQRSELGLKTSLEKRLLEKYQFYRHILSSQQAVVYCIENLEDNITSSSFIEEFKIKYDLDYNQTDLRPQHYSSVIKNIFDSHDKYNDSKIMENDSDSSLLKEKSDFSKSAFSLTYYKYSSLKDCPYRFYLEHLVQLEVDKKEFSKDMENKVFGTFVHDIFDEILKKIDKDNLHIEKEYVSKVCKHKFAKYHLKINNYYSKYYQNVILNQLIDSITNLFRRLRDKIDSEVQNIYQEWSPQGKGDLFYQHNLINFKLSGRIDLVIKTENKFFIIDFKTGGSNLEQLDFYALLLNSYLKDKRIITKNIYNVMEKKFDYQYRGSEKKFRDKLEDLVEEFVESDIYQKRITSSCNRCDYHDICRGIK